MWRIIIRMQGPFEMPRRTQDILKNIFDQIGYGDIAFEQEEFVPGEKSVIYMGHRWGEETEVLKDGNHLDIQPSRELYNHSSEFNWGYEGSGAAQLALALLYDATGDKELSISLHQNFKREYVSGWGTLWTVAKNDILAWVKKNQEGENSDSSKHTN